MIDWVPTAGNTISKSASCRCKFTTDHVSLNENTVADHGLPLLA